MVSFDRNSRCKIADIAIFAEHRLLKFILLSSIALLPSCQNKTPPKNETIEEQRVEKPRVPTIEDQIVGFWKFKSAPKDPDQVDDPYAALFGPFENVVQFKKDGTFVSDLFGITCVEDVVGPLCVQTLAAC